MSLGVSQYITIEHSSHQEHADALAHAPQVHVLALQLRVCVRVPQVGQFTVCVCGAAPGVHSTETPAQVDHSPNAPQVQLLEHVRVLDCEPLLHAPQARVSIDVCPGVQLAVAPVHSPVAVAAPHSQLLAHVCRVACIPEPHKPHACIPVRVSPGVQSAVSLAQALHSGHGSHAHALEHTRARTCMPLLHAPHGCTCSSRSPARHAPGSSHGPGGGDPAPPSPAPACPATPPALPLAPAVPGPAPPPPLAAWGGETPADPASPAPPAPLEVLPSVSFVAESGTAESSIPVLASSGRPTPIAASLELDDAPESGAGSTGSVRLGRWQMPSTHSCPGGHLPSLQAKPASGKSALQAKSANRKTERIERARRSACVE